MMGRQVPLVLALAGVFAALGVGALGGGTVMYFAAKSGPAKADHQGVKADEQPPVQAAQQKPAAPKAISRGEFKDLVMGKEPADVIEAVGRPDKTQETGNIWSWYYDRRTIDQASGKVDATAQVVFRNGLVVAVNY